ncbi:hypothetical protein Pst134EA_031943 [Puccinia striiformis f. sp. tritici]|uniref:uncharacterized protein n=1 Tax=Puccinia striiformis f. sp. tritici TaxID=168172 RepID=UPI002007E28B|nr:uncharacterized protein Pst134EA_031943 [Puccinia striiformis f. sp. tritici]KAH9444401.1 hypothetical protein Pst134EA_031943 [Puccinia striiformis f. sp. tritici]
MCLKVCHVSSDFDGAKLKFDLIYDKYQPAQGLSKGGTRWLRDYGFLTVARDRQTEVLSFNYVPDSRPLRTVPKPFPLSPGIGLGVGLRLPFGLSLARPCVRRAAPHGTSIPDTVIAMGAVHALLSYRPLGLDLLLHHHPLSATALKPFKYCKPSLHQKLNYNLLLAKSSSVNAVCYGNAKAIKPECDAAFAWILYENNGNTMPTNEASIKKIAGDCSLIIDKPKRAVVTRAQGIEALHNLYSKCSNIAGRLPFPSHPDVFIEVRPRAKDGTQWTAFNPDFEFTKPYC